MSETKIFNPRFTFVVMYSMFTSIAYYVVTPFLISYMQNIGIALALAGTVSGVISITALVVRPFSGIISDNMNKKYVMAFSAALMGIAIIGLGCVSSVPMLFVFRILQGVGFALNGTCLYSMARQYMPQDKIGEATGYVGLSNILAQSIGPTMGNIISDHYSYKVAFFAAGLVAVAASAIMLFFRYKEPEKSGQAHKFSDIKPENLFAWKLMPFVIFAATFSFSNGLAANFLRNICMVKSIENYSLYFTINALVMVMSRPLAGKLTDRKGLKAVLVPSYVFAVAAVILIGGATGLSMILLAAVFKALGQGTAQPALQAECLKRLGAEKSGVATSTYYIGADFANGIAPAIGGAIAESHGYSAMFYTSAVILALGLVGFLLMPKNRLAAE